MYSSSLQFENNNRRHDNDNSFCRLIISLTTATRGKSKEAVVNEKVKGGRGISQYCCCGSDYSVPAVIALGPIHAW